MLTEGREVIHHLGKILYLPKANALLLKHALKFKPDLFLSFSSPYAAQVSSILRKPHIAFDDTEHARLGTDDVPAVYRSGAKPRIIQRRNLPKQTLFNGYMELCYFILITLSLIHLSCSCWE
jgi:uncharacterized protein